MKHHILAGLLASAVLGGPAAAQAARQPGEERFVSIFKELVEINSSSGNGSCTPVAEKVKARLLEAGFPEKDLHVLVPKEDARSGNLVAIYPGSDPKAKAVLMLGHIDVVNAKPEDWERDPFKLIEENGVFYGRGTSDMKGQVAIWVDNLIRFKQENYRPKRTIKMALTCGEESGDFINGADWLGANHRQLIDAGVGLNEGGGGVLDDNGKRLAVTVAAADKSGEDFILEVTNPGGHSSVPRADNAIYTLARGLDRLSGISFPVNLNAANSGYFSRLGPVIGGELGAAMTAIVANPNDAQAEKVLRGEPRYNSVLRTVCTATKLDAGHALNALPQRARAYVNCRIMPGESIESVKEAIVKTVADPEIKLIGPLNPPQPSLLPNLGPRVMGPIEKVAAEVFPGLPVMPAQTTGGTDSKRLIAVGIPTFGISGKFPDAGGNFSHGLNERVSRESLLQSREFLYRLVKQYAEQK